MKKIFLDCGANRGQSIIYARKMYGADTVVHSFEAVPVLYQKLEEKWNSTPDVFIYNNACWIADEEVKIYIATTYSDASTLYLEKQDRPISPNLYNRVMGVDMARFIVENFSKEDYIILKFDIEGAEYDLMYHLAKEGVLPYINEVWGEWHLDKFPADYVQQTLLEKHNYIQKALAENNLTFRHWDVQLTETEKLELTLDQNNRMPMSEITFDL